MINLHFRPTDKLTTQCNRKVVNFLDVTLNLEHSTYRPYIKDNNKIIDVNTESNRPLSIIIQLPKSIELRLSQLLAKEEIFKNSITPYNEVKTPNAITTERKTKHHHQKKPEKEYNMVQSTIQCKCCNKSWEALPVFIR